LTEAVEAAGDGIGTSLRRRQRLAPQGLPQSDC
jgi:hypothetical protein